MAKVVYKKNIDFKLFGVKIFSINTDYSERSNDDNTNNDDFYIDLNNRILERQDHD